MERKKRKTRKQKKGSRTRGNDESVLTLPPLPPFNTREREKQAQQEDPIQVTVKFFDQDVVSTLKMEVKHDITIE